MSTILEDVKAAAIMLSPADRCELINFLEAVSFDETNSIRDAWEAESRRRFVEIESGTVTGVPINEVFRHRKSV